MTNPRDADDFSTAPIDASEDEDLGEGSAWSYTDRLEESAALEDDPKADHEPTTVTIGTATGTVEVTVTPDV